MSTNNKHFYKERQKQNRVSIIKSAPNEAFCWDICKVCPFSVNSLLQVYPEFLEKKTKKNKKTKKKPKTNNLSSN